MKKYQTFFLIFLCVMLLMPLQARAEQSGLNQQQPLDTQKEHFGTAGAVIVYEMNTQTLVYAHKPDVRINPTDMVELMTVWLAVERGNLQEMVTVDGALMKSAIWNISADLKAGEEIRLLDLLYCVMLPGANDAAAMVAQHIAGSQSDFVALMNEKAAELGCQNTHFTNVNGKNDDNQYSTARDLAIITEAALQNPTFAEIYSSKVYTVEATNLSTPRNLTSANYMMDESKGSFYDSRVTGGKAGYATTKDRSVICTAENGNNKYLCVVMSAISSSATGYANFADAGKWLDYAFSQFSVRQVLTPEQSVGQYAVAGGANHVTAIPDQVVYALLPKDFDAANLRFESVANDLSAPLEAGSVVGTVKIYYGDMMVGLANLTARHAVAAEGAMIRPVEPAKTGSLLPKILIGVGITVAALVLVAGGILVAIRLRNTHRWGKKKMNRKGSVKP